MAATLSTASKSVTVAWPLASIFHITDTPIWNWIDVSLNRRKNLTKRDSELCEQKVPNLEASVAS
jgi:hypothetical protein